jgi:hypothetical protein
MIQPPSRRSATLSLILLFSLAVTLLWLVRVGKAADPCTIPGFVAKPTIRLTNPRAVAVDDFNGDGKLDLAVAKFSSSRIAILLGDATGGFSVPVDFDCGGSQPTFLAAGDLNGDGKVDLVTANQSNVSGEVSFVLGDGAGGFGDPTSVFLIHGSSNETTAVAIGDVTGDGKVDLVLTTSFGISILQGNGGGGFSFLRSLSSGGFSPSYLVMRDFSGDGKLDLAVTNNGSGNIAVLLGNGAGNFSGATLFAVGMNPVWLAATDLNGDGKLDLLSANNGSGNISILKGDGTGNFTAATNYNSGGENPQSIAAADFNGDGKIDLAVYKYQPGTIVFSWRWTIIRGR